MNQKYQNGKKRLGELEHFFWGVGWKMNCLGQKTKPKILEWKKKTWVIRTFLLGCGMENELFGKEDETKNIRKEKQTRK